MPYEPDPGQEAPEPQRLAFQAIREVRHTVIRVIAQHLRKDAAVSWQGLNFDFTGTVFDGGSFSDAEFPGGRVLFTGARFSSSVVLFIGAHFSGSTAAFNGAEFSGGNIGFGTAEFSGGKIDFGTARFSGTTIDFTGAQRPSRPPLGSALFTGAEVDFSGVSDWSCPPAFPWKDTPPSGVRFPQRSSISLPN